MTSSLVSSLTARRHYRGTTHNMVEATEEVEDGEMWVDMRYQCCRTKHHYHHYKANIQKLTLLSKAVFALITLCCFFIIHKVVETCSVQSAVLKYITGTVKYIYFCRFFFLHSSDTLLTGLPTPVSVVFPSSVAGLKAGLSSASKHWLTGLSFPVA